jgi:hypothetical protein
MKEYYPCPLCFLKGRVKAGRITTGKEGYLWKYDEIQNRTIIVYRCSCGAELRLKKEAKE